jgi:hypothetical protein
MVSQTTSFIEVWVAEPKRERSTGRRTTEGKAKVAMNAYKGGAADASQARQNATVLMNSQRDRSVMLALGYGEQSECSNREYSESNGSAAECQCAEPDDYQKPEQEFQSTIPVERHHSLLNRHAA